METALPLVWPGKADQCILSDLAIRVKFASFLLNGHRVVGPQAGLEPL